MLSNKPYLIRAFYEWIADSACTPYVLINANFPGCKVPESFIEDGEIVFNISRDAVRDLKITNDVIEFKASFTGMIRMISVPVLAVTAIYAEENGEGMYFDQSEERLLSAGDWIEPEERNQSPEVPQVKPLSKNVSYLRVVEDEK